MGFVADTEVGDGDGEGVFDVVVCPFGEGADGFFDGLVPCAVDHVEATGVEHFDPRGGLCHLIAGQQLARDIEDAVVEHVGVAA